MKTNTSAIVFLILLFLASCTPAPQTAEPGTLYVDPTVDLGPISPYLFGSNYGPMHAVPVDMVPVVMDAEIKALRFPGGAWGDVVDIPHTQIDQFVTFYEQMGALPTISARLMDGTPEKAAGLVRYVNLEKKYGVVYWSIGNEPTLFEEQFREPYDTVRFNREWRAIAEAMKAVDPSIMLMGPELHGTFTSNYSTNPKDSAGRDWMTEFLKANGDLVDIVTYHRYPFPHNGKSATIKTLRQDLPEWTTTIIYLRDLIKELTGRDLPIAVTEIGADSSAVMMGEATPDSLYAALWYADVIGQMAQQKVFMLNQWVLSQRSTGLGLIHGSDIRPTLYTFYMYKHFGNELVSASSGVIDVTIYAARREDGALTIMVINLSDAEQRVPLQVRGNKMDSAEIWLLDATHNASSLGILTFAEDGMVSLPPQSATLFVMEK